MIKADIFLTNRDRFYHIKTEDGKEITGYELFFLIIEEFKNKFNYTIHLFDKNDDNNLLYIIFKEADYTIRLNSCGNKYYLDLEADNDTIENFTERYNYLKEIIN